MDINDKGVNKVNLKDQKLKSDLIALINVHGFSSVLSVLEEFASDYSMESVRKCLEESFLIVEENIINTSN